ncbi:type III pantothenate kinase [Azotobacter armeniacus]
MIIELDCGNSFIKWRIIGALSQVVSSGVAESAEELFSALEGLRARYGFHHCRMVSVRSDEETACLEMHLTQRLGLHVLIARSAPCTAGVHNGYVDYRSLGLDRWMAIVAAHHLSAKACLVLDLGTAVTADFVAADGEHKGGFICPGLPLLHSQLHSHTRRIRYDATAATGFMREQAIPGRSTAEAVERGCVLMLKGFVHSQVELAKAYWGNDYDVFLTGGDASVVMDVLPRVRVMPDLVFIGLAIVCPVPS